MTLKEKIIELRSKKLTYNEIKDELGCSKSTISYHCSKIEKKEKSFLLENVNIDKIVELRKNKISYSEIKEITGFSIDVISKVCREFNLTNSRKFSPIDDDKILEINNLYRIYRSSRKVSKELGISRDSVMKYLNDDNKELSKENRGRTISKSQAVVDWRKRTKIKLVEYKGGCCCKCGYNKSIGALEFHHLDPNEKDFTISGKSWSFDRLKNEVDKCILVCSNCHIEIHEEIRENRSVAQSVEH